MKEEKYTREENAEWDVLYYRLRNITNTVRQIRNGTIVRSEKEKAELKTKAYGSIIEYKEKVPEELRDLFDFNIEGLEGMLSLI